MRLTLRYMRAGDVQAVSAIDRRCFEPPWSSDSFVFEIRESTISHMVVLEAQPDHVAVSNGWRGRVGGWLGQSAGVAAPAAAIVGYGGLWQIEAEAHVSTIATHPKWRGRGYGELLLTGMMKKALRLGAQYLVLEVRVSNAVALRLYQKYGFDCVGRKRKYYRSNQEDAWDMRLTLDADMRQRFGELYGNLRRAHEVYDDYSNARRPRG